MRFPIFLTFRVVWSVTVLFIMALTLASCENSHRPAVSAEQITEDKKRFMQQINRCFLKEYATVEVFNQPVKHIAMELRGRCSDEFSAFRAAKLNYAMVRDVIEPSPKMVEFEVDMAQLFVEAARSRAELLFERHPSKLALPYTHSTEQEKQRRNQSPQRKLNISPQDQAGVF